MWSPRSKICYYLHVVKSSNSPLSRVGNILIHYVFTHCVRAAAKHIEIFWFSPIIYSEKRKLSHDRNARVHTISIPSTAPLGPCPAANSAAKGVVPWYLLRAPFAAGSARPHQQWPWQKIGNEGWTNNEIQTARVWALWASPDFNRRGSEHRGPRRTSTNAR